MFQFSHYSVPIRFDSELFWVHFIHSNIAYYIEANLKKMQWILSIALQKLAIKDCDLNNCLCVKWIFQHLSNGLEPKKTREKKKTSFDFILMKRNKVFTYKRLIWSAHTGANKNYSRAKEKREKIATTKIWKRWCVEPHSLHE